VAVRGKFWGLEQWKRVGRSARIGGPTKKIARVVFTEYTTPLTWAMDNHWATPTAYSGRR